MAKIGKFSGKYGLFLSDASNEEIVSVSKELMNGVSSEVKGRYAKMHDVTDRPSEEIGPFDQSIRCRTAFPFTDSACFL